MSQEHDCRGVVAGTRLTGRMTRSNDPNALMSLSQADYEAIEQAVMETARGRWFLREFAARNRNSDTNVLLEAIGRLESTVGGDRAVEQIERVRSDLLEMARSIAGLKLELDSSSQDGGHNTRLGDASSALDGIVRTTEQATSTILEAAESIQEIAWSLREQQFDEAVCDRIDRLATDIYTSCGFQDLTAQGTQKVVRTLRFLEARINALIDAWSSDGRLKPVDHERIPDVFSVGMMSQNDVDFVIVENAAFDDTARPDTAPTLPSGGTAEAGPDHAPDSEMPANIAAALSFAEAVSDIDEAAADILDAAALPGAAAFAGAAGHPDPDGFRGDEEAPAASPPAARGGHDEDVVDDLTARPAPVAAPAPGWGLSLAGIDTMPTTAKAMIFG